ncbi:MAG: DUF4843 domain-containing protein [Marinifilaceae bacterium]
MKLYNILKGTLLLSVLAAAGCSEVTLDKYNGEENSVYFGMINTNPSKKSTFLDSTTFSFGEYVDLSDTTIYLRVNAMGDVYDVDRSFEYEVIDSLTTAVADVFYSLPERVCVIPANETCGYIPVKLHSCDEMKKRSMYYLAIQLKPNNNFNLDLKFEYVDKTNKQYVELTRHWLGMSMKIQKPASWFQVEPYFLDFSGDKYRLINQLCKLTKEDWVDMQFYNAEAYWVAVRNHLQKNIDAGTPIMEENDRTGKKQVMKVRGLTGI